MSRRAPSVLFAVAASAVALLATAEATAADAPDLTTLGWRWPVDTVRIVEPYAAPPHAYGPGHRGVDLALDGGDVRAPSEGIIAFAGPVAGRGVVTIDHGGGLVTTLEPVEPLAPTGSSVSRGDLVAARSEGGHTPPGVLHFGVRLDGEYINPMLLLGGVPRAVLLPCC